MSVVIDASVLVAAVVDHGSAGTWSEGILESGPLFAPHLVLAEATNIIRRFELSRRLTALEATAARRDLLRIRIGFYAFAPLAERIWALRLNLTSYDAWYVALAEALELPMATLDRRLVRASGPLCEFLTPG